MCAHMSMGAEGEQERQVLQCRVMGCGEPADEAMGWELSGRTASTLNCGYLSLAPKLVS